MPCSRPLGSDELGRKGESRFAEICADGELVANPSTVDRRGWDFIVEWPHGPGDRYDERDQPISCRVQVKTVWEGARSVKLRLSSFEALSKDLRPAFLYVFEVAEDLRFGRARLFHVSGSVMEDLLTRLRRARRDRRQPNRVEFSFALEGRGAVLLPTGAAFRSGVEASAVGGMAAYAMAKQAELDTIGGRKGRVRFEAELSPDGDDVFDEVSGFFLGKRAMRVVQTAAFDARLGIDLPLPALTGLAGTMRMKPRPTDACTVTATTPDGSAIQTAGQIFLAPRSADGRMRALVRTLGIDITIDAGIDSDGRGRTRYTAEWSMEEKVKWPARDWRDLSRLIGAIGSAGSTFEIVPRRMGEALSGRTCADVLSGREGAGWSAVAGAASDLATVLERVAGSGSRLRLSEVWRARAAARLLSRLLDDPSGMRELSFACDGDIPSDVEPLPEHLYFDRVGLDAFAIAFAASLRMVRDGSPRGLVGRFVRFVRMRRIEPDDEAYWRFLEEVQLETGIQGYYVAKDA